MLRRIIAAAFTLAALTIPAATTSAVADDYPPDEFPCNLALSAGTVPEGEGVTVGWSCPGDPAQFEAAGAGTMTTPSMAYGDTVATPMVTDIPAMTMPLMTGLAAMVMPTMADNGVMATLMVTDEDGTVVSSQALELAEGESGMVTITGLAQGEYWVSLVDDDGNDLADPARLTVTAAAPPGDGLAVTGSTGLPYLAVAGGLLLVGITALVAIRRVRSRA